MTDRYDYDASGNTVADTKPSAANPFTGAPPAAANPFVATSPAANVNQFAAPAPAMQPAMPSKQGDSAPLYRLKAVGGTLDVYDDKAVIVRSASLPSLVLHGVKGNKTLYYHLITGLQLKKAGLMFNGYLQFTVPGGKESTGGIFSAITDENTVVFRQASNDMAGQVHTFIEGKILASTKPGGNVVQQVTAADEILKMKSLFDAGVISQDEFESFKKKHLGL